MGPAGLGPEQHRQSDPLFTEILTAMRLGALTLVAMQTTRALQDEIHRRIAERLPHLAAVTRPRHPVAVLAQELGDQGAHLPIILDDKDVRLGR